MEDRLVLLLVGEISEDEIFRLGKGKGTNDVTDRIVVVLGQVLEDVFGVGDSDDTSFGGAQMDLPPEAKSVVWLRVVQRGPR